MRSVLVSSKVSGGAARATLRLYDALLNRNECVEFISRINESEREEIKGAESGISLNLSKAIYYLNYVPAGRVNFQDETPLFSPSWTPSTVVRRVNRIQPDVINLHWVTNFVNPEHIPKFNAPVVWTLHDMWPFTGGCHYTGNCSRYENACGNCPLLEHPSDFDLSRINWARKDRAWTDLDLTIVTPSTWLAECARSSSLFSDARVEVIHNGVNLNTFEPVPSTEARQQCGLPDEENLVLLGGLGEEYRKGTDLLTEALRDLDERDGRFKLVTIGGMDFDLEGIQTRDLGYVSDSDLPAVYSAVDATVVPSRQENLSNMIIESLACGTPTVAFDIGGMSDMIWHKETGFLAEAYDTVGLADGLEWVFKTDTSRIRTNAREIAEKKFSVSRMADEYQSLYKSLL